MVRGKRGLSVTGKKGRPTIKSTPEALDTIFRLAATGKTDKEIAEIIGISERTITRWKALDWEFSAVLKENKAKADQLVESSLFQSALGYEYEEEVATQTGVERIRKHQPANSTSQIYWLKNRKPKEWRDKPGEATVPRETPTEIPGFVDLLMNAAMLAYSELQRLKIKAQTEALTPDDHRSIASLSKSLIDVKASHDEITSQKEKDLAKIPTDQLLLKAERLIEEVKKNEREDKTGE